MDNAQAYDALMGTFKDAWDTTGLPSCYWNVPMDAACSAALETGSSAWVRAKFVPNTRNQDAIGGGVGGRKFRQTGLATFEVYTPQADGGVLDRQLTQLLERAFEGISTPNGLWFRNVRTNPVGPDGFFFHSNVFVETAYDEIR